MSFARLIYLILFFILYFSQNIFACEMCTIPRLGRDEIRTEEGNGWFSRYMLEYNNFHEKEAREAHNLHHDGHHFHNKTTERIHHVIIGRQMEDFSVLLEIPYVIRNAVEIDSHSILGSKQRSEGLGDMYIIGTYKFWKDDNNSLSLALGPKFPTGGIKEKNSIGTLFEPEMQPGSGSYDYVTGLIFKREAGPASITANAMYVIKTEGKNEFHYGDTFSSSLMADYLVHEKVKLGIDTNIQNEGKQKHHGAKVKDSGGFTVLMGPAVAVETAKDVWLLGEVQWPIVQDLGGVHQTLDYTWRLGGKIHW